MRIYPNPDEPKPNRIESSMPLMVSPSNHEQRPGSSFDWLRMSGLIPLRTALYFLAVSLSGIPALGAENPPPDPVLVTPEETTADAIRHSPTLKAAGETVGAAAARTAQGNAAGYPVITVEARALHYENLEDSSLGPGVFIPAIENRYQGAVTLTQPLFTGGRISGDRRSASLLEEASRHRRTAAASDVALGALAAYWNWSKAFFAVDSLKAARTRMESHGADMARFRQNGMAIENDVLATDVRVRESRLRLDEGIRRESLTRARLAFLTGRTYPPEAAPVRPESPAGADIPPETELLLAGRSGRPEISARRAEIEAAENQTRARRGERLPQIYVTARAETARPNSLFFPPRDRWENDVYAGLAVSWNLFDGGLARAREEEARRRAAEARLRQETTKEEITLTIREARIALEDALGRASLAEDIRKSAASHVETARREWRNGVVRNTEVLDALAALAEAELATLGARADAVYARAALDHATGRLPVPRPAP
ncbi:MAG: TolC family protein [Planctomycetota bacterium]